MELRYTSVMKFLKKVWAWEKAQMQKPEVTLSVWIAFGVLFGIGIDNVGAGIAVGVAIGVALYSKQKKSLADKKEEAIGTYEDTKKE